MTINGPTAAAFMVLHARMEADLAWGFNCGCMALMCGLGMFIYQFDHWADFIGGPILLLAFILNIRAALIRNRSYKAHQKALLTLCKGLDGEKVNREQFEAELAAALK